MDNLPDTARYDCIVVDLLFEGDRPGFGDLFTICGYGKPNFPHLRGCQHSEILTTTPTHHG